MRATENEGAHDIERDRARYGARHKMILRTIQNDLAHGRACGRARHRTRLRAVGNDLAHGRAGWRRPRRKRGRGPAAGVANCAVGTQHWGTPTRRAVSKFRTDRGAWQAKSIFAAQQIWHVRRIISQISRLRGDLTSDESQNPQSVTWRLHQCPVGVKPQDVDRNEFRRGEIGT